MGQFWHPPILQHKQFVWNSTLSDKPCNKRISALISSDKLISFCSMSTDQGDSILATIGRWTLGSSLGVWVGFEICIADSDGNFHQVLEWYPTWWCQDTGLHVCYPSRLHSGGTTSLMVSHHDLRYTCR